MGRAGLAAEAGDEERGGRERHADGGGEEQLVDRERRRPAQGDADQNELRERGGGEEDDEADARGEAVAQPSRVNPGGENGGCYDTEEDEVKKGDDHEAVAHQVGEGGPGRGRLQTEFQGEGGEGRKGEKADRAGGRRGGEGEGAKQVGEADQLRQPAERGGEVDPGGRGEPKGRLGEGEQDSGEEPTKRERGKPVKRGGGGVSRDLLEGAGLEEEGEPAVVLGVEIEVDRERVGGMVPHPGGRERTQGERAEAGEDEEKERGPQVRPRGGRGLVATPKSPGEDAGSAHVQRGKCDAGRGVTLPGKGREHAEDGDLQDDEETGVNAGFARGDEAHEREGEEGVEDEAEKRGVRMRVQPVAVNQSRNRRHELPTQQHAEQSGHEEEQQRDAKGAASQGVGQGRGCGSGWSGRRHVRKDAYAAVLGENRSAESLMQVNGEWVRRLFGIRLAGDSPSLARRAWRRNLQDSARPPFDGLGQLAPVGARAEMEMAAEGFAEVVGVGEARGGGDVLERRGRLARAAAGFGESKLEHARRRRVPGGGLDRWL